MGKIEILKAKVDYHKTMMTVSIGAGIGISVARRDLAESFAGILLLICTIGFLLGYIEAHKQLIRELNK